MVKKLKWYDDRFRSVYRFRRPMLTLEEANERLHKYFPNLTLLKYYGTDQHAEVYCSDCGTIFTTCENIKSYLYGERTMCEICKESKRVEVSVSKLREVGLEYIGYNEYLDKSGNMRRNIEYRCLKCGYTYTIEERKLVSWGLTGCKNCRHLKVINNYKDILEKNNCTFISTKSRINTSALDVLFRYNDCQHEHTIFSGTLVSKGVPKCPKCKGIEREKILDEFYSNIGFKYIRSLSSRKEACLHLLCGHSCKKSYVELNFYKHTNDSVCRECRVKLSLGKAKEHNKYLVGEYLNILEYTLYLKDELTNKGKEISEISNHENYEFICDTLKHVEGWLVNFKAIKDKYPNGDLGTVLENNPYYLHVWNIVVPALEGLLGYDN